MDAEILNGEAGEPQIHFSPHAKELLTHKGGHPGLSKFDPPGIDCVLYCYLNQMKIFTDPVLSCKQAVAFEKKFFTEDRHDEWTVMNEVGEAMGDTLLRDMRELRTIAHRPRLLVLVGKGHNGGDALLAAKRLLRTIPTMRAVVWPLVAWSECRPFVLQALEEAKELVGKKLEILEPVSAYSSPDLIGEEWGKLTKLKGFDATLDGLLGMQAKLPLRSPLKEWVHFLNQQDTLGARVAVDMPTGISDNGEGFDESAVFAC